MCPVRKGRDIYIVRDRQDAAVGRNRHFDGHSIADILTNAEASGSVNELKQTKLAICNYLDARGGIPL